MRAAYAVTRMLVFLIFLAVSERRASWERVWVATAPEIMRATRRLLRASFMRRALRAMAEAARERGDLHMKASILRLPAAMARRRSFLATDAAERMAYIISFLSSARAVLASREEWVSLASLDTSALRRRVMAAWVFLFMALPTLRTAAARRSPFWMAVRRELLSSALLASSRDAMSLRPERERASLRRTAPVSLVIALLAFLSFLATTLPSLSTLRRNLVLVWRIWSIMSRRMRRVAASMAAFLRS